MNEKPKFTYWDWGVFTLLGIYVLFLIIFGPSEMCWIDYIGMSAWLLLLIKLFVQKRK